MTVSYSTVIRAFGNNAGIEVPPEQLHQLGAGKRPRVLVQIDDYQFSTTVGAMSGRALISLSKAHRDASGLAAGQAIEVTLKLDVTPGDVGLPVELAAALAEAGLTGKFAQLAPSRRKEYARQIGEAKAEATRARRLAKILAELG
jgi:hypothetical protein